MKKFVVVVLAVAICLTVITHGQAMVPAKSDYQYSCDELKAGRLKILSEMSEEDQETHLQITGCTRENPDCLWRCSE